MCLRDAPIMQVYCTQHMAVWHTQLHDVLSIQNKCKLHRVHGHPLYTHDGREPINYSLTLSGLGGRGDFSSRSSANLI